jgi:hypothetical protein
LNPAEETAWQRLQLLKQKTLSDLSGAKQTQHIENRQWVTTRDSQVVQSTGNLHHPIRNTCLREAQDIFDNPTAFDPRHDMFHHHSHRRE